MEHSWVFIDKEGLTFTPDKDIFNCGWGMILITDTLDLDIEDVQQIGKVVLL